MFDRLIEQITPGSRLLRAWPLTGGISATMTALEIASPASPAQWVILRRPGEAALQANPYAAADEYRLLQALAPLALGSPRPIHFAPPGDPFPGAALVIEYIQGSLVFAPADLENTTRQMAERLARIHRLDVTAPQFGFLPRSAWAEREVFPEQPETSARTLPTAHLRAALQAAWPFPHPNHPALLHGDFWPGNILWQGDRLAGVIDWEDAAVGDPLADLAITRLDLLWIFGRQAMDSFTRRYHSLSSADLAALPYWDLCAALRLARLVGEDLEGWAAFFLTFGRADISPRVIREHYQAFTQEALAKIGG